MAGHRRCWCGLGEIRRWPQGISWTRWGGRHDSYRVHLATRQTYGAAALSVLGPEQLPENAATCPQNYAAGLVIVAEALL